MSQITYVVGDATNPQLKRPFVICHCVNDMGGWGSGFVVAISRRWKSPEHYYRAWARQRVSAEKNPLTDRLPEGLISFELGSVQFVEVEPAIWVANLVGQHRTIGVGEVTPIRYNALETGFAKVRDFCEKHQATLCMPKIGAGLARGDWDRIEGLINKTFKDTPVNVRVYTLT